jgi:dienelactone hydrolase
MGWSRRPGALVIGVAFVALAACGGGDDGASGAPPTTAAPAPPEAPFEVAVVTETFVDPSRTTDATAETPALPDRTIVTRISHPTSGGPYPLVVMSHGATGHPDELEETAPMWAAEGFVVAQPAFPLTNREAPDGFGSAGDVVNQPGDVSFVIDQVLAAGDDPTSPLHGLVDPEAIGVVGHSLGGATTYAVTYDTAMGDDRIDAAVVFAGLLLPMPGGGFDFTGGPPLLILHGDADDVPIGLSADAYSQAVSPKWFVTLLGAGHVPAFTDAESPHDDLVNDTVLAFLHGTLDGDAEALASVSDVATDPELSTVQHE